MIFLLVDNSSRIIPAQFQAALKGIMNNSVGKTATVALVPRPTDLMAFLENSAEFP